MSGNLAFLAETVVSDGSIFGRLRVIDISDPRNPKELSLITTPVGARGVAVAGMLVFVAQPFNDGALSVVNIQDPRNPQLVATIRLLGGPYDVLVDGNIAYAPSQSVGLVAIDVSDPRQMREVGFVDTPSGARRVAIMGKHLYLADASGGFQVYRVRRDSDQ